MKSVWRIFRRRNSPDALDQELNFHIEVLTEANIARGMSPEEARRRALIDFGGAEQVKQNVREVDVSILAEACTTNLKTAIRFIRKSPTFSITVIVTLAIGIGVNSAMFSAIDAVVLRPLPFPGGDQLVTLYQHDAKGRDANHFVAPVRLEDWNRLNSTFQAISGYYSDDLSETSGPLPERVTEALVAPRFLQVMGTAPALGRGFTPQEEHFGGPDAALISYGFWQRRFHGDPAAVGQTLHIGSFDYSIIGVMPASFKFPNRQVDLWAPSPPDAPYAQSRASTWFTVVGRMKPGVTVKQALADLSTVQGQLGKQFSKTDADLEVQATPLKEVIVGGVRSSLWLLYGSVTVLLLIACLNIAALLLARTTDREHEIAIRFSLGAAHKTIVAQLLTEVFVLALAGSLAGLAVAAAAAEGLHRLSATLPRAEEITLNWRVALYALACAVATTLVCGLFPALRGARRGLARSLAHSGRTQASARSPLQWGLVGVQVALAVTLLVGAGLLLRSFQELGRVLPGFDPSHILTLQISGSWGETTDMNAVTQRINRTLGGLRSLPGVEAAATSGTLPGVSFLYQLEFNIDGQQNTDRHIFADTRVVSGSYFETMRIPLLDGATCPQASSTPDIVVNRSFANLYLSATSPLGHLLTQTAMTSAVPGRVVGIVGDAREQGMNAPPVPIVYWCSSAPNPFPNFLVRTHGDPMAMAESIRRRIHEVSPARSVYGLMPLQEHLDDAFLQNRLRTMLLTFFAVTAVSLACIGIYGTLSYLARLRLREVGVRLALGSSRSQIVSRFLLQGLRVAAFGCVAGLALGLGLTHFLAGMLYGVSALDPATYGGVTLVILLVAALASLLPAVRVANVDPMRILREE